MQDIKNNEIWIYSKTPFENSFQNVIKFNNEKEISDFFNSKYVTEIYHNNTYSQIRKNGNIQVEGKVNLFEYASYMRFVNDGRMFYAFILDCTYTNENTTCIIFEIDVWMTYHLELLQEQISGFIEQSTLKIKNDEGNLNIIPLNQGFNTGTKVPIYSTDLQLNIDWLIIVLKPSAKIADSDPYTDNYSYSGCFKSFRYFIAPINMLSHTTYSFKYNGTTYRSVAIRSLIDNLTNVFDETDDNGVNTVNQCVNMYLTKHCGLDYELNNDIIEINTDGLYVHEIGAFYSETPISKGSASSSTTYSGTYEWTGGDLTYSGHTFPEYLVGKLIYLCRIVGVMPSYMLTQIYYESWWGDSTVAQNNNNWSGVSCVYFEGEQIRSSGVIVTCGGSRSPTEGGNYYKYSTVEDYLIDHMHMMRPMSWNDGGMYAISGKTNLKSGIYGLFTAGGEATGNYAEQDVTTYYNNCSSIYTGIKNANPVLDEIDALVYDGSNWLSYDPYVNNPGLDHLSSLVGSKVGSGQCYALAAEYVGFLGGPKMGCETIYTRDEPILPGGDGMCAGMIGHNHDFASYDWEIVWSPTFDELRVGDVIVWSGYTTHFSPGYKYGHVDIIRGLKNETDSKPLLTYTQNWGNDLTTRERELPWYPLECSCTIHPPESITGISSNNVTSYISTKTIDGYPVMEVININIFDKKEIEIPNIRNSLKTIFSKYLNIDSEIIEPQLYTSEFCQIKLFDGYGNFYDFSPELLPIDEKENYTIIVSGTTGDSNHVHYTLKDYNTIDINVPVDNVSTNVCDYNHGMSDSMSKSMTILADQSASFFQANKNQYDATQASFNENKEMQQKTFSLNNKQTALANEQATYNADYAIQQSTIKLVESSVTGVMDTIATAVNPLKTKYDAVSKGISSGFDILNNVTALQNSYKNAEFTNQNNSMRSEANSLSNMQAKLALNQSIRGYNASIKDLDNQPTSVQQLGTDLSFQYGNKISGIYLSINLPLKYNLMEAYNYFKAYGVLQNKFYSDIREIFNNRQCWNYIKCIDVNLINFPINKSHLNAIKSIFITGVRVWNYTQYLQDYYTNIIDLKNEDL